MKTFDLTNMTEQNMTDLWAGLNLSIEWLVENDPQDQHDTGDIQRLQKLADRLVATPENAKVEP